MCMPGSPVVPVHAGTSAPATKQAPTEIPEHPRELPSETPLQHLRTLQEEHPEVADRFALQEGQWLLENGDPKQAATAFERARESVDSTTRTRAAVGYLEAHIAAGHPDAEDNLHRLLRRYPHLSQVSRLRLQLAESWEEKSPRRAIAAYRNIELSEAGNPIALEARQHLDRLATAGHRVPELSVDDRIRQAKRFALTGLLTTATTAAEELRARPGLTPEQSTTLELLLGDIARRQARWEDARTHRTIARVQAVTHHLEDHIKEADHLLGAAQAATARQREGALQRLQSIRGNKRFSQLKPVQLIRIIQIAAPAQLLDWLEPAVAAFRTQTRIRVATRFATAMRTVGTLPDAQLIPWLEELREERQLHIPATYHLARALERTGDYANAQVLYQELTLTGTAHERYYAILAEQQLQSVHLALSCKCSPEAFNHVDASGATPSGGPGQATRPLYASLVLPLPPEQSATAPSHMEGFFEHDFRVLDQLHQQLPQNAHTVRMSTARMLEALKPLAEVHGEAYPWLPRAITLLELGETQAASQEIGEVYLAWRAARGHALPGSGYEAVLRGKERPRQPLSYATKKQRLKLTSHDRTVLARVASSLQQEGTAVGFAGIQRLNDHPRAYQGTAELAAQQYGLDPNLLHGVMRVESVFQRNIVSYAGAVGLMQIMPRTGARIAHALGDADFTTTDLLDPETNLTFAAWYLASLIQRFEGHLPLAIASYNGGPHNVRQWIQEQSPTMPLDAFLELIPFTQTHRYVRRVLTHYAAYRAQMNLPMQHIHLTLPHLGTDPVGF